MKASRRYAAQRVFFQAPRQPPPSHRSLSESPCRELACFRHAMMMQRRRRTYSWYARACYPPFIVTIYF